MHPSPASDRSRRLLGVWAHPDDESYLSAGLMGRTVAEGGRVTVVAVTDGELGFGGDDDRVTDVKAKQRRTELLDALTAVGVHDVRFLGRPDGGVVADDELVGQIADIMRDVRPETVVTFGPDGVTGHADHVATSRATTSAWLRTGTGSLWFAAKRAAWLDEWRTVNDTLGVWMTGEPAPVDATLVTLDLDLSGADLAQKRAALAGHASQTDGLASVMGEETYLRWIAGETFRRPSLDELVDVDAPLVMANWCHPRLAAERSRS